jgi:elongation factor 1-alpha
MNNIPIFSPENNSGNNEYKYKLCNILDDKIYKIATQMFYRVQEGGGEAIYTIGVMDDGTPIGISYDEMQETFYNLLKASEHNNFKMMKIREYQIQHESLKYIAEYLVREDININHISINVAMVGNVDSGKSTTLSLLVYGEPDNGRGLARSKIFNFDHEKNTGRTSSIAQHIVGFNASGKCVNNFKMKSKKLEWKEIVEKSSKIITFYDLAGHEKYLKTTFQGMLSYNLDYLVIAIDSHKIGKDISNFPMTKEHIQIAVSMKIPFIIVLTKIDMLQKSQNVFPSLDNFLKSSFVKRYPFYIDTPNDISASLQSFKNKLSVPIFKISNISKIGIPLLHKFLNICPSLSNYSPNLTQYSEYTIRDLFHNVSGTGFVLGGFLNKGNIKLGDNMLLGPFQDATYKKVSIKSIELKKMRLSDNDIAKSGNYITISLKKLPCEKKHIHKNMMLLGYNQYTYNLRGVWIFQAEIFVRKNNHSTTIKKGYAPVLYTNNFRHTVKIISILKKYNHNTKLFTDNPDFIGPSDIALVLFKFLYRPQFLNINDKIWMMDTIYKIVGKVKKIIN